MSAKIWDSSSQAYKDAETPKVNVGGVWQDTEGKVWNGSAWVDVWGGVLLPLVPAMTSNTTPSGEVISSDIYGGNNRAYWAFRAETPNTMDFDNGASPNYIGYVFPSATKVKMIKSKWDITSNQGTYTFYVQATNTPNNSASWVTLDTFQLTYADDEIEISVKISNSNNYFAYRLYSDNVLHVVGQKWCCPFKIQFYG